MSDPKRRSRRRAYFSEIQPADHEHPFLTPNGYRLQRQQPMNESPPQPLPTYPRAKPRPQPTPPNKEPQLVTDDTNEIDLQNVRPSKKFPDTKALDRRPLAKYCRHNVVSLDELSQLKAIGKLFIQTPDSRHRERAMGTAWVAGPSIIATSAHNVFDFTSRMWSTSLEFQPAYDHYREAELPVCRVTACTIPSAYLDNPETNSDIAICHLDRNIGDMIGVTIPMKPIDDDELFDTQTVSIVGYPSTSGFDFGKQMWQSVGQYLFGRRNYPGDDYAPVMASSFGSGASGSPWLIRDSGNDLIAIGATSGHARIRQAIGAPNLMSLTSPYFGPRMFDKLSDHAVFHEFE